MAIITLLEKRDFEGALRLLHEAREVASSGSAEGGSASSKAAFAIYEAIIESASGGGSDATAKLEAMANRRRGLISAFSAWALALHFRRTGEPERAVPFQQLVHELTPNCGPLNEFSTALPG